uniref:BBS2_Mid domain-containing protein n=1 Tax=Macrostomum lignano TaxID=282301 RepID=A0A1I8FMZ8_9PLAT
MPSRAKLPDAPAAEGHPRAGVTVGRFDGRSDTLACAAPAGRNHAPGSWAPALAPNPVAPAAASSARSRGVTGAGRRPVVGEPATSPMQDLLLVGSAGSCLAYDVLNNADAFFRDALLTVSAPLSLADLAASPASGQLALVGGKLLADWGYDRSGNDVFWSVTGDNVSSLSLCVTFLASGAQRVARRSEDYEIRVFQDDEIVQEITETEVVQLPVRDFRAPMFAYGLANGTVGVYERLELHNYEENAKAQLQQQRQQTRTAAPAAAEKLAGSSGGGRPCRVDLAHKPAPCVCLRVATTKQHRHPGRHRPSPRASFDGESHVTHICPPARWAPAWTSRCTPAKCASVDLHLKSPGGPCAVPPSFHVFEDHPVGLCRGFARSLPPSPGGRRPARRLSVRFRGGALQVSGCSGCHVDQRPTSCWPRRSTGNGGARLIADSSPWQPGRRCAALAESDKMVLLMGFFLTHF